MEKITSEADVKRMVAIVEDSAFGQAKGTSNHWSGFRMKIL